MSMNKSFFLLACMTIFAKGCAKNDAPEPGAKSVESHKFEVGEGVDLEVVYLAGGQFKMGAPEDDPFLRPDDFIARDQRVEDFWIGKYEVTQQQYCAVMGPAHWMDEKSRVPATRVSWSEAMRFCELLSQRTGWHFSLPTEAQWEYACLAGSGGRYCFGDDPAPLTEYAVCIDNERSNRPEAVGSKKPNSWGVYDMHGNVFEWCLDEFDEPERSSLKSTYPEGTQENEYWRVIKGGSWGQGAAHARCAYRAAHAGNMPSIKLGFRVVATPPDTGLAK